MADPAVTSCNHPDHATLITTVGEQSRLIGQLFAKIQVLEKELETAREAARSPALSHAPTGQAPNFATSAVGSGHVDQQNYSPPAPSPYENKKTQAQGQPCHYGSKCTREQCWYEHPAGASKPSISASSQSQPAGNSTKRIKKECNYGINCTRKQCWFEHPSDWVPPGSAPRKPQPQQEFDSEAAAAEVDNWGTGGDLSSWDAAPTNDWGTPVGNSWGTPAQADNEWTNPTETNWNAQPAGKHKSPAHHSRSPSASMSHEGSVSNLSTKSQGRGRKARGKGRKTDSESIATESAPMSPPVLAPTPMSYVDPIPTQTPLSPPVQPVDQMTSFNEPSNSEEMNTPPLEPSGPSHSSEPEAPATPKALWDDEFNVDVVYYSDPPREEKDMDPSEDQSVTKPVDESLDLDETAPSDLYSSWGVTGASASDWGLDPNEYPDPTPTYDNQPSGKKSKAKGKQKAFQTGTTGRVTPMSQSSNFAAQSGTRTPSVNESNEPEQAPKPIPDPPQGVPQDEIPDWLLGVDEDAHATLGIPRSQPKPEASSAPPRLAPTNPAPRPPLSKLAGENFPTLISVLPTKSTQSKDVSTPGPTFTPRPVGWKITRTSDTSSSSKGSKSKSGSSKK